MGATGSLTPLPHPFPGKAGRKIYLAGGSCRVPKHRALARDLPVRRTGMMNKGYALNST